ncbi:hypothetical protein FHS95_000570 [Sphingomonas naasensis]|uniref:Uncharacterized protein n=1 Tax=Sphingomonas naasensis TaxID=1344951 RepID=A0A4S1WRV6_9SPHN|nr:hypothetical protein [Sphingomonas naasensis]NIJ18901.1 hypothetical protein [Sphingomonas naasensis]TGX46121.1 hypothetical protein E5A74_02850 [Sphingomonas naasensis]
MYRGVLTIGLLVSLAGCTGGGPTENASIDSMPVTNAAVAGEMIFCREINRRTTRQDCDDLTDTASQAARGTAAFNVPPMTRGKSTMIVLAISLEPPPVAEDAAGGAAGNFADTAVTPENASAAENASAPVETPTTAAMPTPRPPHPGFKGAAPADVVKGLPGETEQYSPLVGRDMRAELIGQGFKIEPRSEASQVLSPGSTTSWEWEVTPLRGSNYVLAVKTAVEGVMANGTRVVLRSTVETRAVNVKVAWYDRVRDGLTEAPDWIKLVTGVLIALAALFAAWWKLVRSAKGEKVEEAKPEAKKE